MPYAPKDYAQALIAASGNEHAMQNLFKIIRKNGDWSRREKIVAAIEVATRKKSGRSLATIVSARPLTSAQSRMLEGRFPKEQFDYEHKINLEFIAGVRVEVDGESQIDSTLASSLRKVFRK